MNSYQSSLESSEPVPVEAPPHSSPSPPWGRGWGEGERHAYWKRLLSNYNATPWRQIDRAFPVLVGGLLFGLALIIFISKMANPALVPPTDSLLQTSRDNVLLLLGTAALVASITCLFAQNLMPKLLLTAWLATIFAAYRIGLFLMGFKSLNPYWGSMADAFGVPPSTFDWLIEGMFALLSLGGGALLAKAWLTKGRILNAGPAREFKMPCPSCRGNIKFAFQNLGQKTPCPHCRVVVTLRKPDSLLKMSCFFCKENIEFPAHAVGTKLKCPHCSKDIALMESE